MHNAAAKRATAAADATFFSSGRVPTNCWRRPRRLREKPLVDELPAIATAAELLLSSRVPLPGIALAGWPTSSANHRSATPSGACLDKTVAEIVDYGRCCAVS